MLFLALLAAFVIDQLLPLSERNAVHALARRWALFARSKVFATQHLHVWMWWAVAVLVPVALSVVVYQLLLVLWLPLAWLWLVVVLYHTMGFRQFSHHFSRIRDALQDGDEAQARTLLAQWRQVEDRQADRPDWIARVLSLALLAAQRHVLGVWLAFAVFSALGLGPAGAVLYRMTEYVARLWRVQMPGELCGDDVREDQLEVATQRSLVANTAWQYTDWLPVRVTALGFAAAGNFEGVVGAWRDAHDNADTSNDCLLLAAGAGALSVSLQLEDTHHGPADAVDLSVMSATLLAEQPHAEAISQEGPVAPAKPRHVAALSGLVWRVVVLAMGTLAGLTLVAWVG